MMLGLSGNGQPPFDPWYHYMKLICYFSRGGGSNKDRYFVLKSDVCLLYSLSRCAKMVMTGNGETGKGYKE